MERHSMSQDQVFLEGEADRWFARNRDYLARRDLFDWPLHLLSGLAGRQEIKSVLEVGCSNGWRLARMRADHGEHRRYVGVDPSEEALAQGRAAFPGVELHRGLLSELPLRETFDLVIVNYVLHWVDRGSLARSVAEIDRMVADGGYLLVGDFLPDHQQKRSYHHLPGADVFTFKQNYAGIFTALGTYSELVRVAHGHAEKKPEYAPSPSGERAVCCLLRKSLSDYYALAT
jgi:SAM-dependent methyltransferase